MITKDGSQAIARLLASGGVHLGIGVGSGEHPESHANAALAADGVLGSAWYRPADVTFPAVTDGGLLVQATFGPGEAEFWWREWCLVLAGEPLAAHHELAGTAPGAAMISRCLPSVPLHSVPKQGRLSWVLRVPLQFHVPD